jgi:hypothetical protein
MGTDLRRLEHLLAALCPGQTQRALGRAHELGAIAHRLLDEFRIQRELEHAPGPPDLVAQRHRPHGLGHVRPQAPKVIGAQLLDLGTGPEDLDAAGADPVAIAPRLEGEFTRIDLALLGGEVLVGQYPHGEPAAVLAGRAARVQIVPVIEVSLQRPLGVVPGAEELEAAADLLGPAPRRVGEEREVWIGLGGLG